MDTTANHEDVALPDAASQSRRVRADARHSIARILDAAQKVFTDDPNASLAQVAAAAGLGRTTVHRHFASRQALLDALVNELNSRYVEAFEQARCASAPPLVALHRLTELALELKVSHPFVISLTPTPDSPGAPASDPEIQERLELLFKRLYAAGEITVDDPAWCRQTYLALLHEVYLLPAEAAALAAYGAASDEVGAKVQFLTATLVGALSPRSVGQVRRHGLDGP